MLMRAISYRLKYLTLRILNACTLKWCCQEKFSQTSR